MKDQEAVNRESQDIALSYLETIKELAGIKSRVTEADKLQVKLARDMAKVLGEQNSSLSIGKNLTEDIKKKQQSIQKNQGLINKTRAATRAIEKDLKGEEKKAYDISKKALETLQSTNKERDELLNTASETGKVDKKRLEELDRIIKNSEDELKNNEKNLSTTTKMAMNQSLIADQLEKQNKERQKEADTLTQIEKSMGGLRKATQALGNLPVIGSLFTDSLTAAEAEIQKIVEETGKVPSKFEAAKIQLNAMSGIALNSGLAFMYKHALAVDKSMNDIQRSTGMTEMQVTGLNYELQGASVASGNMYMTSLDMMKTFGEISKQIGMSAEALGAEAVVEATALKDQMGLSADAAGGFAAQASISGKNVKAAGKEVFEVVNKSNKLNKTMYSHSEILAEVGKVSADIGAQYGFNTEKLAEAAVEAKRLGMNMSELNSIASALVNFEDSIAAEMEAELLTGQQLNLEKARQLALNNDLAGLGKELESQGITAEKFSKMNRIQQEAQAKALGMNSEQMGKMLQQQELARIGAEKFTEKYGEATYEATNQVDVQKKLEAALTKIADALAPILSFFAGILSNAYVLYSLIGVMLLSKVKDIAKSFRGMRDNLKESAKFAKDLIKGGIDKLRGKGKSLVDKVKPSTGGGLMDKAAANTDKAKGAAKGAKGAGPGGFLKSLGEGLASMGQQYKDIMKGALALGVTVAVMGVGFAFAMQMVKDVDPVQMIAFSGALTMLGLSVAFMGKVGKDIMKGALAMGVLAIGLIPAAFAFSLLAGVDASSIIAFSIALPLLALAIAGIGALFMGPQLIAFGLGIAMIAALGVAIIPAAMAFNLLKDADIESILSQMIQFGSVAPQLMMLGGSLVAIAGGLGMMAGAGLLALPIIGALTALGLMAPALESLAGIFFGGGGDEGEDETMEILIEIRDAIKSGGKVYLDGNEVGKTLKLGTYKT